MKSGEQLSAIFLSELDDRARSLGRELLALEREPADTDRIGRFNALFRTAHSLKGAAGAMGVELVELVCHRLEEIFTAARDARLDLDADLFRLFFACADAIECAGHLLRRDGTLAGSALAGLLEPLEAAIGRATPLPPARTPAERPPEPKRETIASPSDEPVVRIAAQKLDALVARTGELLTLSWHADERIKQLSALRASLRRCQTEWRATERQSPRRGRSAATGAYRRSAPELQPEGSTAAQAYHGDALRRVVADCDHLAAALVEDRRALEQATGSLDAEVRRTRMLPFTSACDGLERIVRDLSKSEGKQVEFSVVSGELELDRAVIQGLRDPLIHLVRNAVDHGIEDAATRRALGKPEMGRVTVGAGLVGTRVEVSVADDGTGLDLAAIQERARALQLPDAEGRELIQRIFLPGFSTHDHVTQVSGRGIGLDAVRTAAKAMRGAVEVAYDPGRGTRFTLSLPLTLSTVRALLVSAGGETFAIDAANIDKLLLAARDKVGSAEGRSMLLLEAGPVPVLPLAQLLGMDSGEQDLRASLPVAMLRDRHRRLAVVVDEFVDEREIEVRRLGPRLDGLPHVGGGTILPTGKVALILNVADLVESAVRGTWMPLLPASAKIKSAPRKRVLLVDDSMTTRALERSMLEVAGYEVIVAADGDEAWRLLLEGGADIVVSDVDMPRMDGFALTEAIRGSARFEQLPVVLVTARESQEDKARGMAAGADTYLVKSAFDQKALLDALAQLL